MADFLQNMKSFLCLVTVEPVLFFYMMIVFLETTTLQGVIFTKVCLHMHQPNDTNYCNQRAKENLTHVVAESATWGKYLQSCLFFSTLLVSFYVGSWADHFGRKLPMLIPPCGSFIASAINFTLSVYIRADVTYLFISAAISGLTFGSVGIIATTFGYISDITSEESRTKRIIILEAMIYTGGTLGSYIAGALLNNADLNVKINDYAIVFLLELAIAFFIIAYIIFRIPNHQPSELSINSSENSLCSKLFGLNHVADVLHTVFKQRQHGKRLHIILLLTAAVMSYYGLAVQFTLFYLFLKNEPLRWTVTQYSYFSAAQTAVEGVALLFGLPLVFHFFHLPDNIVAMLGIASRMSGLILFGLSGTSTLVFSCVALFVFSEFTVPVIRSLLSKIIDSNERGKMFAFTTILQNMCFLTGSLIFNSIFESSLSFFPGLCFEIVAFLQAIAFGIFCYLQFSQRDVVISYEVFEGGCEDESVSQCS